VKRSTPLPPLLSLAALLLVSIACNLPAQSVQEPPTASPTPLPPTPLDTSTVLPPSSADDLDTFAQQLQQSLVAEDYATLERLMGEAFSMGYLDGASGLITVTDAVTLLRDELLSGTDPIAFDPSIDVATIGLSELEPAGIAVARALFSTGWGAENVDQALIFISTADDGRFYFSGMLYARGGFPAAPIPNTAELPPTLVAAPTPNPAPHGPALYQTDFRAGWAILDEESVRSEHTEDGYRLDVFGSWAGWAYTTRVNQSQFYAEITARPEQCPVGQGSYGLMFHHQDSTHFRFFVIWCSGLYSLHQRSEQNRAVRLEENALPTSINPSSGEHRIGVLALNNVLTLYVDDIRVAAIGVSEMPSGDVGPYVETTGPQTTSVTFTELRVYQP